MLMRSCFHDLRDLSIFVGIRDETHEQNTEKGKNGRCQKWGGGGGKGVRKARF